MASFGLLAVEPRLLAVLMGCRWEPGAQSDRILWYDRDNNYGRYTIVRGPSKVLRRTEGAASASTDFSTFLSSPRSTPY